VKIPCSLASSFSYVISCVPFSLGSVLGSDVNALFHRNGIDSSDVNLSHLKIFESSRVVGYPSCFLVDSIKLDMNSVKLK